ncbi:phage holin family protein [Ornithinimicrobium ciconiae]|uniref:Phage holin family protein n=1 Tax=Ornithinimicrobium ciconiae TaxID=2594265 RepID=A0A516G731_9MICO|nr:phage holin family protein [Ornithinimicrobium ciconiae]QDO87305.1 phage holin family protein [Ornithinimicrobium ciconiae]
MNFLIKVAVNGVALWIASLLFDGIVFEDTSNTTAKVLTVLAVGLIFGVLNSIIKPILFVLSLPIMLLTLGLFTFILNAFMLWLTGTVAGWVNLGFEVTEFWWDAIWGALIITIVSMILNAILPDGRD